jgi:hypothetical protein
MTRSTAMVSLGRVLAAVLLQIAPLAMAPVQAQPAPPPPLPPLDRERFGGTTPVPAAAGERSGGRLAINGREQRARWLWIGASGGAPTQLWIPLEVLQGQLGISARPLGASGSLVLEWFGRRLLVPPAAQRPLGDEVALDVATLLQGEPVRIQTDGDLLRLALDPPRLIGVRPSSAPPGQRRVVLDLSGPALLQRGPTSLLVELRSSPDQRAELAQLGVAGRQLAEALQLSAGGLKEPPQAFTLGNPNRVVIDLPGGPAAASVGERPIDPRLQARLGRQIVWERLQREVGGRAVRINAVRLDPRSGDLELRPLSRPSGMEGLSSLEGLARRGDALVAINGGFFNRIRRLPLGALRDRGEWRSGPILNRGAIGWRPGALPRFGRLELQEWVRDRTGKRWPLVVLNSGWVQRGISRYSTDWGPLYRSLSDGERGVLIRQGQVVARYGPQSLAAGVSLAARDWLLVARGGAELPWAEGEALALESRPSDPVGEAPFVLGGGPLLLQDGRAVLDGAGEGFGPAFLRQGAPRTVVGSDGRQLWLITLEGTVDEGPTLAESAVLLRQLGLRDALNLDGGSSTGLVLGGRHTVKGRGVAGLVHNALGLVPAQPTGPGAAGEAQPGL